MLCVGPAHSVVQLVTWFEACHLKPNLLLGLQEIEEDLRFSCNQLVLGLCQKFQFLYSVLEPQFWTHFVVVLLNL